jgi:hypothetical protein
MKKPSADISIVLVEALESAITALEALGDTTTSTELKSVLKQHNRGSCAIACPICGEEALSRSVAGKRHIHCLDERCVSNGGWKSSIPTRISPPDYGPWTVTEHTKESGLTVYNLQSDDFIFDAALSLSGDFPGDTAKIYATEMAQWLNTALGSRLDVPVLHVRSKQGKKLTTLAEVLEAFETEDLELSIVPVEGAIPLFMYPPLKGVDTAVQEKLIEKAQHLAQQLPHAHNCQVHHFQHKEDPEIYCTCPKHEFRLLRVKN